MSPPGAGTVRLDPIIALLVALNIVRTSVQLLRRSTGGLMDHALGGAGQAEIQAVLDPYREEGIQFHALRTRQAGRRAFVSLHLLVPGAWTVNRATSWPSVSSATCASDCHTRRCSRTSKREKTPPPSTTCG
jgi:divalent metal cation (Fe/Co/Zn/Cd) transporter